MRQDCFFIPRHEKWVIESLAMWLNQRLLDPLLRSADRKSLMRLLFGLQRFPRIEQGVSIHVEWEDSEVVCIFHLTVEVLSIERGHTRLQYFQGSHHLINFFDVLNGKDRRVFLEEWLPLFQDLSDPEMPLLVTDYSSECLTDTPPLNEQWETSMQTIYFDDNG